MQVEVLMREYKRIVLRGLRDRGESGRSAGFRRQRFQCRDSSLKDVSAECDTEPKSPQGKSSRFVLTQELDTIDLYFVIPTLGR